MVSSSVFFFIMVVGSGFTRIATTLTLLRVGLGLHHATFGVVFGLLAVTLSLFVAENSLMPMSILLRGDSQMSVDQVYTRIRPTLLSETNGEIRDALGVVRAKLREKAGFRIPSTGQSKGDSLSQEAGFELSAFLLSELQLAFKIGVTIILPFLVVDLIVINIFQLLSIRNASVDVVTIPLKLLVFISAGGWSLVVKKLLGIGA
jgi:type III secretory pathway component EscR